MIKSKEKKEFRKVLTIWSGHELGVAARLVVDGKRYSKSENILENLGHRVSMTAQAEKVKDVRWANVCKGQTIILASNRS